MLKDLPNQVCQIKIAVIELLMFLAPIRALRGRQWWFGLTVNAAD